MQHACAMTILRRSRRLMTHRQSWDIWWVMSNEYCVLLLYCVNWTLFPIPTCNPHPTYSKQQQSTRRSFVVVDSIQHITTTLLLRKRELQNSTVVYCRALMIVLPSSRLFVWMMLLYYAMFFCDRTRTIHRLCDDVWCVAAMSNAVVRQYCCLVRPVPVIESKIDFSILLQPLTAHDETTSLPNAKFPRSQAAAFMNSPVRSSQFIESRTAKDGRDNVAPRQRSHKLSTDCSRNGEQRPIRYRNSQLASSA